MGKGRRLSPVENHVSSAPSLSHGQTQDNLSPQAVAGLGDRHLQTSVGAGRPWAGVSCSEPVPGAPSGRSVGQGGNGGSLSLGGAARALCHLSWPQVVTGPGDMYAADAWVDTSPCSFCCHLLRKCLFSRRVRSSLGQAMCIPNSCWCWGDGSCWVVSFCGISQSPEGLAVSTEAPQVGTPTGKAAPPPLSWVQLWCEYPPPSQEAVIVSWVWVRDCSLASTCS